MPSAFTVVAIIAAYNEADIIEQVVRDLVLQGIAVYVLDDGSSDGTVAAVEPYVGRGVLAIERLKDSASPRPSAVFEWERILRRKMQLAGQLDASWFIHHDADEFRESPWSHLSLRDAIQRVDALGYNAIDFAGLDFWPIHDRFRAGDDVRERLTHYTELAPYDRLQIRCWKKTADLDLASSGGHDARFPGRNVFPVRFILRHYPIRGQAHGERKIFRERRDRFLAGERSKGWHVQYDDIREGSSFIRDPTTLVPYDSDAVRLALTLRHRGVEELENSVRELQALVDAGRQELEQSRSHLARACAELEAHRVEIDVRGVALEALHAEAEVRRLEIEARGVALEALRADLHARRLQSEALQGIAGRDAALRAAQAILASREAELVRAGAEHRRLGTALDERAVEIERWRAAVDDATRRLAALEHSWSWRWTAPLRAMYRLFK